MAQVPIEFVWVIINGEDRLRVEVKAHWNTLPDDEGFTLLTNQISRVCRFTVETVRDTNGARLTSLSEMATGQTLLVGSLPARMTDLEDKVRLLTASVETLGAKFEEKSSRTPVAPNLIKNSLLREVDSNGAPTGFAVNSWKAGGSISINAAHPYTHGFEGCYTETPPDNFVTRQNCDLAGPDCPVWFSRYNTGPRLARGGLFAGWGTVGDGHILKLQGSRVDQHEATINLPIEYAGAASRVRFVAWIKCVKGCVNFAVDYPNWGDPSILLSGDRKKGVCRPQDCVWSPEGWFHMDDVVTISNITLFNYAHAFLLRCFGPVEEGGLGDFEIYLGLIHASLVEDPAKVSLVPFVSEW